MSDFAALAQALAVVVQDYTPSFTPHPLPPGPVNDSSPINLDFNNLTSELSKIATSIKAVNQAATNLDSQIQAVDAKVRQIGLSVTTAMSSGASIPIPAGFSLAETRFFAIPGCYNQTVNNNLVSFQLTLDTNGKVTYDVPNSDSRFNVVTGVALSRQGGW
ncbi:hypothetical protein [Kutzneria sp. NPDC052558]|uniref:hypothetical protein n=1 Tax=Kutzneria sp. NPDC052558 TaxID=3364121 RepID=UPI0037CB3E62